MEPTYIHTFRRLASNFREARILCTYFTTLDLTFFPLQLAAATSNYDKNTPFYSNKIVNKPQIYLLQDVALQTITCQSNHPHSFPNTR